MRLPFFNQSRQADAEALYAVVVAEMRRPAWYRDGGVPDTLDGRFAVLASLLALADIRLERGADEARSFAPRLAEVFIADMDAQMRQAGLGDPGLGKQVRRMVGAFASRVDRWRRAVEENEPWDEVARSTLYADAEPPESAAKAGIEATRDWWGRLERASDAAIIEGRIG